MDLLAPGHVFSTALFRKRKKIVCEIERLREKETFFKRISVERSSRRRKTPTIHTDDDENESLDANGKKWKKPKISGKSPEKEANISSANVTVRRSRRGRASEVASEDVVEKPKQRKRKAVEEDSDEPTTTTSSELPSEDVRPLSRVMTPMLFDETKVGGRFCSTPIRGRDSDTVGDVTFDDVNLSAITENEPVKNRKSHAQYLQQIFEEDEEN
ncbi:hypothetical protein CRE_20039 [Caenorhabditis remanei]|uniref:Uncharacterized protein n=1 Tax=Caenorhabditis remanei TaxID=31234 RepID=E3NFF9_CAERE|nr:hypothetical protein CRE_20039 [Caenorhabditis remanei]